MNAWLPMLLVFLGTLSVSSAAGLAAESSRFSRTTDTYFMEDDQVYARFLWFQTNGRYRQINRDSTTTEEVDRGTWEQTASGQVALHPTDGMLTFRAVAAGPLLVMLDTQARIDSLPILTRGIASFLQSNDDLIFARTALFELAASPSARNEAVRDDVSCVTLPNPLDTLNRSDLEDLLRKLNLWLNAKNNNMFAFEVVTESPAPLLLIQQGAVFSKAEVPDTRAFYHTRPDQAPPFYFARISQQTFLTRAGAWKPFANLGGVHTETSKSRPVR